MDEEVEKIISDDVVAMVLHLNFSYNKILIDQFYLILIYFMA